jgi:hypothetical protein
VSSASEIANTRGKSRVVMTILKKKSKEGTKNSFKKNLYLNYFYFFTFILNGYLHLATLKVLRVLTTLPHTLTSSTDQ